MNVAMRAFSPSMRRGWEVEGEGEGIRLSHPFEEKKVRKYILFHTILYYNYTIEFDIKSGCCSCPDGKV